MRYLWDGFESYRSSMSAVIGTAFAAVAPRIRAWDREAAGRVTWFLANSSYVADRIARCYGREAEVLHPPIAVDRAPAVLPQSSGDHYLCAGRLVSYKRTELAIEACLRLGRRLRIVGAGPETARLRRLAEGSSLVEFLGELDTPALWAEYAACRALLFAADEDFGMVPLEAQACGRPVIAYGAGGSLETVRGANAAAAPARPTGIFFAEQTADSLAEAILRWEQEFEPDFEPAAARAWAETFATPAFLDQYRNFVTSHVPEAESFAISAAEAAAIVAA